MVGSLIQCIGWADFVHGESLLRLREDIVPQVKGYIETWIEPDFVFWCYCIYNIDDVIAVDRHDLSAFDHRRFVIETGVPLDRHIGSDIQAFHLGCDVADDHAVRIAVSHVVLTNDSVMIALHDVTSG